MREAALDVEKGADVPHPDLIQTDADAGSPFEGRLDKLIKRSLPTAGVFLGAGRRVGRL